MDTIEFLREQLAQSAAFIEGTVSGMTHDDLHAPTPGACNPVGATLAHLVHGEDGFVHGLLRRETTLAARAWTGRTGMSAPPPAGPEWTGWGRTVEIDLDALMRYARAVFGATDSYIASLTPEDLDREIDLSSFGLGARTLGWVLGAAVLGHRVSHWGEICALKGLGGGRGFPF